MADGASPVYVIMAYPISNYQRFKNAMMRNKSILANYSGVLICSAPEVRQFFSITTRLGMARNHLG